MDKYKETSRTVSRALNGAGTSHIDSVHAVTKPAYRLARAGRATWSLLVR